MRVIRCGRDASVALDGAVFAIGNFDGIHCGHRALIGRANDLARAKGAPLGVLTFEPHPRSVLGANTEPFRLTSFRGKVREIGALGADVLVALRFNMELARVSAENFVRDIVVGRLRASHLVVGYDFVFGHKRAGNAALLRQLAATVGFGLTVVDPVGNGDEVFASGRVRAALRDGDVLLAARVLGRRWEIEGRVRAGERRGRALGFPTINLDLADYVRPRLGIYAARVALTDDAEPPWRDAVTYIGSRPTFDGENVVPETHILDFDGALYARRVRVALIDFIRADHRFENVAALREQMESDCAAARCILADPPTLQPEAAHPPARRGART